ncbi:MAG TPA: IPT/TIG domain-containing protein, partial [Myxococcales bacterium]|nr:IPT/TIG domain-containing protein [Myxococcales bacterium]
MTIRTVSPTATAGLSSNPMIAVTIAASAQAPAGASVNLTVGGATSSTPPSSNSCVPNLVDPPGPVNAPVSITNVDPGGGLLPAGSLVAVVGNGFQPGAQVLIDGVSVASTSWVDSSHIDVVTAVDAQLDGRLVSVTNPDLTGATYVSYLRATVLAVSAVPLLAATQAIFPVQPQSSATLATPTTGTFFGLALQNPQPADSIVSVDLSEAGSVVASATVALPPRSQISLEVSELFPGVIPSADTAFELTATVPVQVLGLSGNENDGSVTAVLPAPASPSTTDPYAPAAQ